MRRLSTIYLLIFFTLILTLPAESAYKGGITYSIPIEYKNLSESELNDKAKVYYHNALRLKDREVNEDMTNALLIYSILQDVNPNNPVYPVKLGILYDKIGKDRYAKGGFSRAIGVDSSFPDSYFYFGEFYYKRQLYRSALRYYKRALEHSYKPSYDLYYRLGDIYEKFGDTKNALKYLKLASEQSPNSELDNKIKFVEGMNGKNSAYYNN